MLAAVDMPFLKMDEWAPRLAVIRAPPAGILGRPWGSNACGFGARIRAESVFVSRRTTDR